MDISRELPAGRSIARPLALFFGTCALSAIGTTWLAWTYLPYDRLRRFSPQEQFLAWEGVVWLLALVAGLLGISCVLQVVGWRLRKGVGELVRHLAVPDSDYPLVVVSAVLPWGMVLYGLFLVLIAGLARSYMAP
jgi:hypothetical protein